MSKLRRNRLTVAQSEAEKIQVTDESLQRIREAVEIADQANARLRGAATRINFELPSDRLAGIEVDGTPLSDASATVEAVEPVIISISERGRIQIEPAIADRDQLQRAEREARADLHAALGAVGAESLADAQILRDRRRDLEVTASAARQELERLAPSDSAPTLQRRVDELRQALEALPSEGEAERLPQRDRAEVALQSAQAELQQARDNERIAREAVDVRVQAVSQLSVKVRTLENTVNSQAELIERRQDRLRSDSEARSDQQIR